MGDLALSQSQKQQRERSAGDLKMGSTIRLEIDILRQLIDTLGQCSTLPRLRGTGWRLRP